jgi:hypothetical protein
MSTTAKRVSRAVRAEAAAQVDSASPIRPIWWDRPARPLSKSWKRWIAENFIRSMDGCHHKDALDVLTLTRTMVPRRGRVRYDWSKDAEKRQHP